MTADLETIKALADAAQVKPVQTAQRGRKWAAAEILKAEFPEPKWAIPEIVPAGLVVLAGRPKLGKSWLALQMAVAVGSGGIVLGKRVAAGKVLYLAYEDSARRIQSRLQKQRATTDITVDFHFDFGELVGGSGVGRLIDEITANDYSLVVIDTISRALGKTDQQNAGEMNAIFGILQQIAISKNLAVVLVDHHRKSASDVGDVIDDVMSATSKTAVADAVLGLYRRRGERAATLKLAGRDVAEMELAITFDRDICCWQFQGDVGEVRADEVQGQIVEALRNFGGTSTVSEIARYLGKQPPNISRELNELASKGVVRRGDRAGKEIPWILAI